MFFSGTFFLGCFFSIWKSSQLDHFISFLPKKTCHNFRRKKVTSSRLPFCENRWNFAIFRDFSRSFRIVSPFSPWRRSKARHGERCQHCTAPGGPSTVYITWREIDINLTWNTLFTLHTIDINLWHPLVYSTVTSTCHIYLSLFLVSVLTVLTVLTVYCCILLYVLMFSFSLHGVRILTLWHVGRKVVVHTWRRSEGGSGSAFAFLFGHILLQKHGIKSWLDACMKLTNGMRWWCGRDN